MIGVACVIADMATTHPLPNVSASRGPSAARIPALTGIRIVPATMIFFYHWLFDATDAWPSLTRAIFKQGYLRLATPTPKITGQWASALIGLSIGLIWLLAVGIDMLALTEAGSPLFFVLNAGVAAATAILLLGLASDTQMRSLVTRCLASRLFVFLGQISYALFLTQLTEPIQWLYWVGLGQYGGIEGRWPRTLLLYIAVLAINAVLYLLIERPLASISLRTHQKPYRNSCDTLTNL